MIRSVVIGDLIGRHDVNGVNGVDGHAARRGLVPLLLDEHDGKASIARIAAERCSLRLMEGAGSGVRVLASGRASEVIVLDERRVLRRTRGKGDHEREAALMRHARAAGYPVPEVFEVRAEGLVMEWVKGTTMGEDLERRPWRVLAHAETLADLHARLHRIAPPPEARARYGAARSDDVLLHGDLHPLNVLLSPAGPVVIDWTNAGRGPGGVDVADTWLVLGAAQFDGSLRRRLLLQLLRGPLVSRLLARAGREDAARHLRQALTWRVTDPNLPEPERAAMRRIAARHGLLSG
jgi:aminoglycoside phosphotransferase (APT) family kinase protein